MKVAHVFPLVCLVVVVIAVFLYQRTDFYEATKPTPKPIRLAAESSLRTHPQVTEPLSPSETEEHDISRSALSMAGPVPLCGQHLLDQLHVLVDAQVLFVPEIVGGKMRIALSVSSTYFSDVRFNVRALGPAMIAGEISADRQNKRYDAVVGPFPVAGAYRVDAVVTWVGDAYLGQKWSLPPRNDNPPFQQKRDKCLALTLSGDCGRFGVTVLNTTVIVSVNDVSEQSTGWRPLCKGAGIEANGYWRRLTSDEAVKLPLLADSVGLNFFDGSHWGWVPSNVCDWNWFTAKSALECLSRRKISRIALFGDSMMVEQFNMLRDIFDARGVPVRQSKSHRLRSMAFDIPNSTVVVKFMRSYTTSTGHSVIADPRIIVGQLAAFRPDLALGNFAVLHWQQNERSLADWQQNLQRIATLLENFKSKIPRVFYVGHTLIQMGRTQGLQPSRTDAFSMAAKKLLAAGGVQFISPYNLSMSRRESAFDGQHWACYHEFGGVAHTIAQLLLNRICE